MASDQTPRPWGKRLVVLAGIILVALNARVMVSAISPLTPLMAVDLPLDHTHEEILGLASPLVFAIFAALSPALGRRFGLEPMVLVALAVTSIGEVARSLATSPTEFMVWTVPTLAGAGIGNVVIPPLIKKYFPDRLGLVTAVYTTFACVSTALPPLLIYPIGQAMGWRFAMGMWAILGTLGLIPWLINVFSPERAGQRLAAIKRRLDPRQVIERPDPLKRPLWKSPVAWGLMGTFAGNSIIGYTMFAWLPQLLRDAGHSDTDAAMYLFVFTVGSLPGALLTPMLAARIKRTWILPPIFFTGYLLGFMGLTLSPGHYTMAWMILTRIGDCFFPYAITMINLKTRSTRGSIAMSGFVQTFGYTVAIIGPWGFGLLHEPWQSWTPPMIALLCSLPILFACGMVVALSRRVDA